MSNFWPDGEGGDGIVAQSLDLHPKGSSPKFFAEIDSIDSIDRDCRAGTLLKCYLLPGVDKTHGLSEINGRFLSVVHLL